MQSNEIKYNTIKENDEVIFLKEGEKENIKIFESKFNKNICIQISKLNDKKDNYYLEIDLESLSNKSKIFKICDSPKEAIDIFSNYINQNKYGIKEINDQFMILTLQVTLFNGKEENIEFQLLKENNSKNDNSKIITELENKIKNLEKEISSLKDINSNLIERITKLEKEKAEEMLAPAKPISIDTPNSDKFYPGTIIMCAKNNHPSGEEKDWLRCNGAQVKIDEFPKLFAILGEAYGPTGIIEENGKKYATFTLPCFEDRVPWGGLIKKNAKENYKNPGLPNITGKFALIGTEGVSNLEGAFSHNGWGGCQGYGHAPHSNPIVDFDARRCNRIYGDSKTVQPPAIVVSFYIKT